MDRELDVTLLNESKTKVMIVDDQPLVRQALTDVLKKNIDLKPGDVFYVPATVMAKLIRVISPVTTPIANAASGQNAATTLVK